MRHRAGLHGKMLYLFGIALELVHEIISQTALVSEVSGNRGQDLYQLSLKKVAPGSGVHVESVLLAVTS